MRLTSPVEHAIYAAAFVERLSGELARGVRQAFRDAAARDGRPTESAVSEWERWCADAALADAESAVQVHRDAVRRRKT